MGWDCVTSSTGTLIHGTKGHARAELSQPCGAQAALITRRMDHQPHIRGVCAARAVEIRHCAQLLEISLEGNRLVTPVLDLRALGSLRSLQLFANPLEFLPELSPCTSLRHLSLANVRQKKPNPQSL